MGCEGKSSRDELRRVHACARTLSCASAIVVVEDKEDTVNAVAASAGLCNLGNNKNKQRAMLTFDLFPRYHIKGACARSTRSSTSSSAST